MNPPATHMRWFVRGDIDGFFGLAVDNLVQLLVINALCQYVLGFGPDLLYGRVLPGVAVSLLVGNLFYAWQAKRLGDRLGRDDVCALPYGINTPSVFAYIFFVMLPVKLAAQGAGASAEAAAEMAWRAGLVACIGSGVIEFAGAFVAERIRQNTPRAALLSTLAGIAITFIAGAFLFRTFAHPIVGMTTLAVVLLAYFGGVKFRGAVPAGLVAVVLGTALAWLTGIAGATDLPESTAWRPPAPVFGDLYAALTSDYLVKYLSVIVPMGLFNLIGSLQNIESAEAAGDRFATAPALATNGLGTLAAACFGSCFPTTIYIGHPGWKGMGARAGYSILNAVFIAGICLTGTVAHVAYAVPVDAAMVIVLWIGIVITAQAFDATPSRHAPAVVVGLLPGIAAWGAIMIKSTLKVAGYGTPGGEPFSAALVSRFEQLDIWITGALSLEQGFILTAMLLAAATALVIDRRFVAAAWWCYAGAILAAFGLIHSWQWTPSDTEIVIGWPWQLATMPWVIGDAAVGVVFVSATWLTLPRDREKALRYDEFG